MSKEEYAEKTTGSSRLGKEAKIGVAVIAALLIVLGAVVAVRLMRPSADDQLAAASNLEDTRKRPGGENKVDALLKDTKPKHLRFGGSAPPIVVSAEAASTGAPKTPTGEMDQWKLVSDQSKSKHDGGPALGGPPPIPEAPKPLGGDRYGRYASDPPPAPQPPQPLDAGASYSRDRHRYSAADSVGQYDADDNRRSPVSPAYRNAGLHHRSAAMSYRSPPARRDDGKYEVQPNDSFWTISENLYGTGAYFKALAEHNRGKGAEEDRLQPGALISAPEVAQLEKSYPDLCPKPARREAVLTQGQSRTSAASTRGSYRGGRTYTVAEGDTLFNIARYELGKASRWAEIYDLNRDVLGKDFNYLTPGTQLTLPQGEKSEVLAEPPRDAYRR